MNNNSPSFSVLGKWLNSLTPNELALIGAITGFLIADGLTINEQNSIGNFLEEVGQIILTINAQATINQVTATQEEYMQNVARIDQLEKALAKLKDQS